MRSTYVHRDRKGRSISNITIVVVDGSDDVVGVAGSIEEADEPVRNNTRE
jgi:hypothetical protein